MRLDLTLKVTQAMPVGWLIEIHFGNDYRAKFFSLNQRPAVMAVDRGSDPVPIGFGVGAADDINMIFTGTG